MTDVRELLNKLLISSGPSGDETSIINTISNYFSAFIGNCYTDNLGNLIAHKSGSGKKIMLVAHADEIGLMIKYIDENGFLYFDKVGGIDDSILPGRKVLIKGISNSIMGVIGKRPIHFMDSSNDSAKISIEDMWIDIAAHNRCEAESLVEIGSFATIVSPPTYLSKDVITSKALDDRIGILILLSVACSKLSTSADVYFVASVQEELGARGILAATQTINPDVGIVIDVSHATDYPSVSPMKYGNISLGKGAVISVGPNMNKEIVSLFKKVALDNSIPFQIEPIPYPSGTDAQMIQVSGAGVRTGLIGVPCRYMHTPVETVSLEDVEAAIKIIIGYLNI